jgi:hypothetical protein
MAAAKKPKALKAHITRLEMTSPPKASLPAPVNIQTAIMRVPEIPVHFYRYLYHQVGARWYWVERSRMSNEALAKVLHDKRTAVSVLYVNGAPAGFYELFHQSDEQVDLAYFGLMEHALGLGLGKWFLLQALYAAIRVPCSSISVSGSRPLQQLMRWSGRCQMMNCLLHCACHPPGFDL